MGASTIAATPSADLTALSTELLEAEVPGGLPLPAVERPDALPPVLPPGVSAATSCYPPVP